MTQSKSSRSIHSRSDSMESTCVLSIRAVTLSLAGILVSILLPNSDVRQLLSGVGVSSATS